MMATRMHGFRKAVVAGAIIASFGMPLVSNAQEKADSISIEYDIGRQMKERETAKENLRREIASLNQKIDSIQEKKNSLVKLGEEAGYKTTEIASESNTEKEASSNWKLVLSLVFFSGLGGYAIGKRIEVWTEERKLNKKKEE